MADQLPKLKRRTSGGLPSVISSPGLGDGRLPLILPDGPGTAQCGPGVAHANHSARPADGKGNPTNGISGQTFTCTSSRGNLQQSLENRLRARMDSPGSLEYELTWKNVAMKSGQPICALRARGRKPGLVLLARTANWNGKVILLLGRPTSGKGFTGPQIDGWRTPDHNTRGGGYADPLKALARTKSGHQVNLEDQAVLAGWGTPRVTTNGGVPSPQCTGKGSRLEDQIAGLTGYPTPAARDYRNVNAKSYKERGGGAKGEQLPNLVVQTFTGIGKSPTVSTEKRGGSRLNPAFSLWLMGFPEGWESFAPAVMPSIANWQRTLSEHIAKQGG
jgi:hypothetical protein